MNRFLKDITIKHKLTLIVIFGCLVALLIASTSFILNDIYKVKGSIVRNAGLLAEMVGNSNVNALINDDQAVADDALKAMEIQPHIIAISVYRADGTLFAEYVREDLKGQYSSPVVHTGSYEFNKKTLRLFHEIIYNNKFLGTVYIETDLKIINDRFIRNIYTAIGVILLAVAIAFVATSRLQKLVSAPILRLAETARDVSIKGDYSLRAEKSGNDEIGFLIEQFNGMLAQIEHQDEALQKSKYFLEDRVKERTAKLESEITERKRIEKERIQRLQRVRKHQKAFANLFNNEVLSRGGFNEAARLIVKIAAEAMDVSQVGIWMFNENNSILNNIVEYHREKDLFHSSGSISGADYPVYFNAVSSDRAIDASDAVNDPRTREFTPNYFKPKGINSLLDAAIRISGSVVGVICFEHIGPARNWTPDEVTFAGTIADQVAQLLMNKNQRRTEETRAVLLKILEASVTTERLEDLLEKVHRLVSTVIDAPNLYVAIYDIKTGLYYFPYIIDQYDQETIFTPQQLDNSLTDYVRRTGIPMLIDNKAHQKLIERGEVGLVGTDSGVWLGVPLKTSSGCIGVMAIQNYDDEKAYGAEDLDMMSFISSYVAMAVERKRTEDIIKANEAKYRTLFDSANDAIFMMKEDKFIDCNNQTLKMFGCTREQIINQPPYKFSPKYQPDGQLSIDKALQKINAALSGEPQFFEWVHCRYDQTTFFAEVSLNKMVVNDETLLLALVRDITERKQAEEQRRNLQEKLDRAERMESLGVLAGGVAHDLNNMLGPLVGYPELILRTLDEDNPIRKQVERIGKSAREAADVIQDLLTLARRGRYEMIPMNLNDVIETYLDSPNFARLKEYSPDIRVNVNLGDDLPNIEGSAAHLSKVIMNLVVNAYDAIGERGGDIYLETGTLKMERLLGGHDKIEPGHYAVLKIRDTGKGIASEDLDKIFEPYFSKKKMGSSGSGLGLSVVYGIVKDHKGYYDVFSEIDGGTEFVIYFPISTTEIRRVKSESLNLEGTEKILIVDDVAEQRQIAEDILSILGYDIVTAANGREALEYLRQNSVDLVVLDMIMENDFDGLDTYRDIIKLHPGQKAVIVSGYSATDRVNETQRLGAGQYIRKPYTVESLGTAIRIELDKAKASTRV